jgi:hypothetical protein
MLSFEADPYQAECGAESEIELSLELDEATSGIMKVDTYSNFATHEIYYVTQSGDHVRAEGSSRIMEVE